MSLTRVELEQLTWRKAVRSINNGDCVEIAAAHDQVFVRDSKNPEGGMLRCTPAAFRSFLDIVAQGQTKHQ
jgi:hypothetical protein